MQWHAADMAGGGTWLVDSMTHLIYNSREPKRSSTADNRSHWGRLRVSGDDKATFLHGQSTADITALLPGQGCDTVFVTAQARWCMTDHPDCCAGISLWIS